MAFWPPVIAHAQEPEIIRIPQPSPETPPQAGPKEGQRRGPVNVQEALGELWFRRKGYLEKGDTAAARRQEDLMRDVIRREGLLSADDIAGAFLADGSRHLEAGNAPRALQSFHLAKEFAPDRPGAFFAVARTLWRQDYDLWGALTAGYQGIRVTLRNPTSRAARLGDLTLILTAGSLLAALLWCLISAFRTARLVQHDLFEIRARSLSEGPAHFVAWALWLLPALVWMTGWWILMYWLVLSVAYLKRSERVVSLAACLCFIVALPALGSITRQSAVTTDPGVRILLEAARGSGDPERVAALEQLAAAHAREPIYHFLLAQVYHGTGSREAALQAYRKVQQEDPLNAGAWINSGNIFFEQGRYAQAAEEYKRAIGVNPRSALAYFNLHLADQEILRLEEADAAFRKARELDNALVTSILASEGAEGSKVPGEFRYRSEEVLNRLQRDPTQPGSGWMAREWVDPLPLSGALGLVGGLTLILRRRRNLGSAERCAQCGQPFCRRCQVGMRREDGFCSACRHLYRLKDPVAPNIREEREKLVASHERWQWISRRLVSLFLPGAGQIQGGRTLLGIGLIWLVSVALAALCFSNQLLVFPRVAAIESGGWLRMAALATLALTWLAGNVLAFERKG